MPSHVSTGRKIIVGICLCLAFGCFAITWHLDTLYYQSRPREPQPAEGRIHPAKVYRGTIVYTTQREQQALYYSSPLGFLIGICAAALLYRGRWNEQ